MSTLDRIGVILLAAGRSTRFGDGDKLAKNWRGKPLMRHAADNLAALPFSTHLAVVPVTFKLDLPSQFERIENPEPQRGLSHSISLGISEIRRHDIDACLIALADMPLVPRSHFGALAEAVTNLANTIVGTGNAGRPQVPALFGRAHFDALQALEGDGGASALLQTACKVDCDPALLADFDRPEDFV